MSLRVGYKRTEIGETPEEWIVDFVGNVVDVNPRRSLTVGRHYPFIPMEALSTYSPKTRYVQKRVWNRSSGSRFQNGDVLLARITPSAENGKTALVDFLEGDERGFGSTEFLVLSPKPEGIVDSRFLYYLVKFEKIRNQAIQRMTGSTGRQRIPPEAFDDILCPVPPAIEQQKIASILSTVDEVIGETDEIVAKTLQLKRGLMQRLLTKGVGHVKSKQTEIGKIPEDWEVVRIGDVSEVGTGGTPSTVVKEYYEPGNVKWMKSGDVKGSYIYDVPNRISELGLANSNAVIHPVGSVMLAMSGRGKTRGMSAILATPCACSQSVAAIIPSRERLCSEFLHYDLAFRYEEIRNITGSYDRSGLNLGLIREIKIPMPPLHEQQEIGRILLEIDRKGDYETLKKQGLEQLKKGLMQVFLTGKVRVKVN